MNLARQKLYTFVITATILSARNHPARAFASNVPPQQSSSSSTTNMDTATKETTMNVAETTNTANAGDKVAQAAMAVTNTASPKKKEEEEMIPNGACAASSLIPPIDEQRKALLKEHGITIEAMPGYPVGAKVSGVDLRTTQYKDKPKEVWDALEMEMANRGYLCFKDQGVMTPDEQIQASCLWGGKKMHSTHGVHPATPEGNRHIFRLSNDRQHGILGVGPQWHNDGSFTEGTFSHVGYHIIRCPERGGGTYFAHQGAAFDRLPPEKQERWQRFVSLNSNSGVLHPVVHEHPISGRKSVWLHLGMTGAVIEKLPEGEANGDVPFRLLNETEMKDLFHTYNNLLNDGVEQGYTVDHEYQPGDFVVIDNLAVGHKASPEAHKSASQQGLRIMHRTTVAATQPFEPGFGLPQGADPYGPNPFGNDDGVWIGGGIGFKWDDGIRYQN